MHNLGHIDCNICSSDRDAAYAFASAVQLYVHNNSHPGQPITRNNLDTQHHRQTEASARSSSKVPGVLFSAQLSLMPHACIIASSFLPLASPISRKPPTFHDPID